MYIDWVTWSIWLVGFAIMVTWIMVPLAEFRKLLRKKSATKRSANEQASDHKTR